MAPRPPRKGKPASRGGAPRPSGGRKAAPRTSAGRSTGARGPRRADGPRTAAPAKGLGGEQVEGRQAVRELLIAQKRKVREIWFAKDLDPAPILEDIEELGHAARVQILEVPRRKLEETRAQRIARAKEMAQQAWGDHPYATSINGTRESVASIGRRGSDRKPATPARVLSSSA